MPVTDQFGKRTGKPTSPSSQPKGTRSSPLMTRVCQMTVIV
jgi:hypothetical protein